MNSVERVRAAIELRQPDRVPVFLHNFQPAAKSLGLPLSKVFQSGDLLAAAMIDAWKEIGHDMIFLENGTACNAQACGAKVLYREDAAPAVLGPILKTLDDVDKLAVPDPFNTFPMCEVIRATRIMTKNVGKEVWICGRADQGPTDLAVQLMGLEPLLLEIATGEKEHMIHHLFDFCREVATRYAYALIESGAHSTCIGESVASPDVLSPRHYRKYSFPQEKRMVEELKERNIILHNHICGNTVPIIGDFVATGAAVLEIDHKTDMRRAKAVARNKACILGTIDTNILASGGVKEVEEACRECIAVMAPDSGFILGPGCAMGSETPAANCHAIVNAARKYGSYAAAP